MSEGPAPETPQVGPPIPPPPRYRLSGPEAAALAELRKRWDATWTDILGSRGHGGPDPVQFRFDLAEGWFTVLPAKE
jgi:hypothetical protein